MLNILTNYLININDFEFDRDMNVFQTRGLKENYKNMNKNLIKNNVSKIKNYNIN